MPPRLQLILKTSYFKDDSNDIYTLVLGIAGFKDGLAFQPALVLEIAHFKDICNFKLAIVLGIASFKDKQRKQPPGSGYSGRLSYVLMHSD